MTRAIHRAYDILERARAKGPHEFFAAVPVAVDAIQEAANEVDDKLAICCRTEAKTPRQIDEISDLEELVGFFEDVKNEVEAITIARMPDGFRRALETYKKSGDDDLDAQVEDAVGSLLTTFVDFYTTHPNADKREETQP